MQLSEPGSPPSPAQLLAAGAVIDAWATAELDANPLLIGVERIPAERRWLIRLRGEDKAVITVWLTLRQRSLHHETCFMPAPEDNVAGCFDYLLRRNSRMAGIGFCIGDEDAVYLSGQVPVAEVDAARLDWIIGASYAYTEQSFRTALSLGFARARH